MTYKELQLKQHEYVMSKGGYYGLTEFDCRINCFSRAKIRAYKRENGKCYLIHLNGKTLREYTHGMVYNFECQYMTYDKDTADAMLYCAKKDALLEALDIADGNNVEALHFV